MKEKKAKFSNYRIFMCLSNGLNDHAMKEYSNIMEVLLF